MKTDKLSPETSSKTDVLLFIILIELVVIIDTQQSSVSIQYLSNSCLLKQMREHLSSTKEYEKVIKVRQLNALTKNEALSCRFPKK